ncbi:hypothetical protein FB45DRAFT_869508 [Roridomyces roridus]|uniref:F-box domain-containing protein n=1 Tax=Roridomyces roridus TaxID=1738132 RepID=A0AAD7BLE7_9AGAR|nr:hypothetical protein FB45DRAFT_869508 [Roridomyces roridus]
MDVSPEVYRDIVRNVGRRSDIATLARVCKGFRIAAQRALYNTLIVGEADVELCGTLVTSPRLASLVIALTVQMGRLEEEEDEEDDAPVEETEAEERTTRSSSDRRRSGEKSSPSPNPAWTTIAGALRNTTRLRHLTVDIADLADFPNAWVLAGCTFQLHTFHCDFDWDQPLLEFLATQTELHDLFIRDYVDLGTAQSPTLPSLSALECTFTEAAATLTPGRPISRLKTCFSHTDAVGRRAELVAVLAALRLSTGPIYALDIADGIYTEPASMELLHKIAHTPATASELRYLGTLALPVGGRKRLQFYGLLMRLRRLRCLEVDISQWSPPPTSSPALRALAAELRLYCPDVSTVVFVHEFERTVVNTTLGSVLKIDDAAAPESMWREI